MTITSDNGFWADLPTSGVIRVHVHHGQYRHTLQGMDRYWLLGETFGMFNDPENHDWYEGVQAVAWAWPTPDLCVPIADPAPHPRAHVLAGAMLPVDEARRHGLLNPTSVSPPRSA